MSEREFRVSENASSPPRAGAGFRKRNFARSEKKKGGKLEREFYVVWAEGFHLLYSPDLRQEFGNQASV